MNLLRKLLAAALCASLLPIPSSAALVLAAKAPTPLSFSATAAAPSASAAAAFAPAALQSSPLASAPALVPLAPAAANRAPLQVKPVLEAAAARIAAAKPGSEKAASALETAYTGSLAASASEEPVPAFPSTLSPALNPAAAAPSDEAPQPPSPRTPRSGKVNTTVLAVIGGVVAVMILIATLIHNGNAKNKIWDQSRAAQEVIQIDAARRSGDASTLFHLSEGARARQKTAQDADAAKARSLDAFDGLVAMRGAANGNAVSTKPEQRPGGQLPSTWRTRLTDAEAAAKQAGSIAPLARVLADLRSELAEESRINDVYAEDLRKFQAEVPTFGGAMGIQASKASTDLDEFRAERGQEQVLELEYHASMRRLVVAKLEATSPEFRSSLERANRLATLASGSLSTLDDLADKIDKDLSEMAAQRRAQRDNLAEADRHKADSTVDANGRTITQDNSQAWKDKAAQNAANAQAAAASAKANIEAFNRDAKTLRSDRALQAESLDKSLPNSASVGQPDWAHGVYRDLLDPWQLDMASKDFNDAEANDARARFGTAKGAVTSVHATVDQRNHEVKKSIDAAVDAEIQRQGKGW